MISLSPFRSTHPLPDQCSVRLRRFAPLVLLLVCIATGLKTAAQSNAAETTAETNAVSESRLSSSVKYLSADEREGRGVGTEGLTQAGDFIAQRFRELGLVPADREDLPFQSFEIFADPKLGPAGKNRLALEAAGAEKEGRPEAMSLTLGEQFQTLALGGSGEFSAPLVFVGYGVTAPEAKYDDYAGVDVKGKVVLIVRKQPSQGNPHSPLGGGDGPSKHAFFSTKVANARKHGAAAIIFVNDHHNQVEDAKKARKSIDEALAKLAELQAKKPKDYQKQAIALSKEIATLGDKLQGGFDELVAFTGAGANGSPRQIPIFFCKRKALAPVLDKALGKSLAEVEQEIDDSFKPQSRELTVTAIGETEIVRKKAPIRNVIGVLEGEGPLANETVVIGAHYDHLGFGGGGSLAPWTTEVHNGADDNASGVASLLEIAKRLSEAGPLPRRIVLIAFSGEERGLLGSKYYVKHPLWPLEKTITMLNMDMVGRLKDNKLIIQGLETAEAFGVLIDELNKKSGFDITKQSGGYGPSDHASFYEAKIPVMHFFTGNHKDYHRPSDDFERLNIVGMRRVTDLVFQTAIHIAKAKSRPEYIEIARRRVARGGNWPYFGSVPDYASTAEGMALDGVAKDGPAQKAGVRGGDIIIKYNDLEIGNVEDFSGALSHSKPGDKIKIVVRRGEQELTFTVTLESRKRP